MIFTCQVVKLIVQASNLVVCDVISAKISSDCVVSMLQRIKDKVQDVIPITNQELCEDDFYRKMTEQVVLSSPFEQVESCQSLDSTTVIEAISEDCPTIATDGILFGGFAEQDYYTPYAAPQGSQLFGAHSRVYFEPNGTAVIVRSTLDDTGIIASRSATPAPAVRMQLRGWILNNGNRLKELTMYSSVLTIQQKTPLTYQRLELSQKLIFRHCPKVKSALIPNHLDRCRVKPIQTLLSRWALLVQLKPRLSPITNEVLGRTVAIILRRRRSSWAEQTRL